MSLADLADDYFRKRGARPPSGSASVPGAAAPPATGLPPAAGPPLARETARDFVVSVVKYVPVETLVTYIILLDVVPSDAARPIKLALFVVCLLLGPAIVLGAVNRTLASKEPNVHGHVPWYPMIASLVSFVAWAWAVPCSIFTDVSWLDPRFGALIAIVTTSVLATIEPLVDRNGMQAS